MPLVSITKGMKESIVQKDCKLYIPLHEMSVSLSLADKSRQTYTHAPIGRPEGTIKYLMNVHFLGNVSVREPGNGNEFFGSFQYAPMVVDWITNEKIRWAIAHFGSHKAAGPDSIAPISPQATTWWDNWKVEGHICVLHLLRICPKRLEEVLGDLHPKTRKGGLLKGEILLTCHSFILCL